MVGRRLNPPSRKRHDQASRTAELGRNRARASGSRPFWPRSAILPPGPGPVNHSYPLDHPFVLPAGQPIGRATGSTKPTRRRILVFQCLGSRLAASAATHRHGAFRMMNRLGAAAFGAAILLLTILPGSAAAVVAAPARVFTAALSGASEVPPVTTAATGAAQVVISADGLSINYQVTYSGLALVAAHINTGAAGTTGGTIFPLVRRIEPAGRHADCGRLHRLGQHHDVRPGCRGDPGRNHLRQPRHGGQPGRRDPRSGRRARPGDRRHRLTHGRRRSSPGGDRCHGLGPGRDLSQRHDQLPGHLQRALGRAR